MRCCLFQCYSCIKCRQTWLTILLVISIIALICAEEGIIVIDLGIEKENYKKDENASSGFFNTRGNFIHY